MIPIIVVAFVGWFQLLFVAGKHEYNKEKAATMKCEQIRPISDIEMARGF